MTEDSSNTYAVFFTTAIVAVTVFYLWWHTKSDSPTSSLPLPGALQPLSTVELSVNDFGDGAEISRDFARTYKGNGMQLLISAAGMAKVQPLSVDEGESDCIRALHRALTEEGATHSDTETLRLVSMVSVSPTFTVLTRAGCLPAMSSHRFVILSTPHALRALVVGFVGDGMSGATPWLLTIASPNILKQALPTPPCTLDDPPGLHGMPCTVEYRTSPRLHAASTIDEEIRAAAQSWLEAFGSS